jgi:hypothetical protein
VSTNAATGDTVVNTLQSVVSGGKRAADDNKNTIQNIPFQSQSNKKTLAESCNLQTTHSQGTNIVDIIYKAYYKKHFKPDGEWSCSKVTIAKFKSCLQLFEVFVIYN